MFTSRDDDHALANLALDAGGHCDDHRADALGPGERLERPVEERPAGELHEGLRAAGSEPLTGAGGRDYG
jgi:hypothetical protein